MSVINNFSHTVLILFSVAQIVFASNIPLNVTQQKTIQGNALDPN